ncbi:MAG TPA: tripartite tricarboxylate transporter permease [Candidatus Thermoplasmatota archaeon]|nr:tripartite tricarboxylate transporter permease [Candidatus Thermoplasmatota archaeon]
METGALFLGLLAAALAGTAAGLAAGLIPGIHVNTLALLLVAGAAPLLAQGVDALHLAIVLIASTGAQAVSSGVPAAFLGAPDPEATASALPGHRLLHEGRGVEAADLHATGVLAGLAVSLALALPMKMLIAPHLALIQDALPYLLLAVILALLLSEGRRIPYRRAFLAHQAWHGTGGLTGTVEAVEGGTVLLRMGPHRLRALHAARLLEDAKPGDTVSVQGEWLLEPGPWSRALGIIVATGVFLLAGLLGLWGTRIPLESPTGFPPSALFPLLTGLFAFPSLLTALTPTAATPREQVTAPATEKGRDVTAAGAWGGLFGSLAGFVPGTSSAHAGIAALAFHRDGRPERTLLVLGAATGATVGFALVTFAAWGRARNGALVAARALTPLPEWTGFAPPAFIIGAAGALLLAGGLGYFASLAAARGLARASALIPERALSLAVLALLLGLVVAATGARGMLLAGAATAVGFLPILHGVRRSHLMGVILMPVTLWVWGLA